MRKPGSTVRFLCYFLRDEAMWALALAANNAEWILRRLGWCDLDHTSILVVLAVWLVLTVIVKYAYGLAPPYPHLRYAQALSPFLWALVGLLIILGFWQTLSGR